jgi:two-component system chemotaxis response regulator CheB
VRYEVVAVGASLGGMAALKALVGGLPASFPLPLAIVQHVASEVSSELALLLQRHTSLRVCEAEDKMPLRAGTAYLAPSGYHLLVEPGALALSVDEPVVHARPSIDVLFQSAADAYGERVIGIALTSSSDDGARGLAAIRARGGMALVQDPSSAESRVLPDAALRLAGADRVLAPAELAAFLGTFTAAMVGHP